MLILAEETTLPKYPEPIPKRPPIKDSPMLLKPRKLKVDKFVILEKAIPAIKPNGISHLLISFCLIFLSSLGFKILISSNFWDLNKIFAFVFSNSVSSSDIFSLFGGIKIASESITDFSWKTLNSWIHLSMSSYITILLVKI